MSFILDALKKSERTRQHSVSVSGDIPLATQGRSAIPWLVGGVALVAINLLALAWFMLRDDRPATPRETIIARIPETTRPTPAAVVVAPETRSLAAEAEPIPTTEPELPTAGSNIEVDPPQERRGYAILDIPDESLHTLDELTAAGALSLPPLNLDMHFYSNSASRRFVFINGHKYVEGDRLTDGPIVERILPNSVRLRQHSVSFLIPKQ